MDELLTVKQVADLLQLHEMTIRRYIKTGKLGVVRIGRNVRVPRQAVEALMASLKKDAAVFKEPDIIYKTDSSSLLNETITRLAELDQEGLRHAAEFVERLRAEQERGTRVQRIREAAHRLAPERTDWPREKVVEGLEKTVQKMLEEATKAGTAFEGEWIDGERRRQIAKEIVAEAHWQSRKDDRSLEEVKQDLEALLAEIQAEAIAKGTAVEA